MNRKGRRVYIHLGYEFDAASHRRRYDAGHVPGKTPYEYHHAEAFGYHVTFSKSHRETRIVNRLRRASRRLIGFDLWHAWRNRNRMDGVEVIWARPEQEYLAILLLRKWRLCPPSTLLMAESIWLFDAWEKLSWWKQKLYRWLIEKDARTVLVIQSDENLKIARAVFPGMRTELIRFGISLDSFPLKPPSFTYVRGTRPLRILSLGNDVHRDWATLVGATESNEGIELRIATNLSYRHNRWLKQLAGRSDRITIKPFRSLEEIHGAYEWVDIVVVPSLPNRHNSGITVILEAVAAGKPVIATDTGGLKGYFSGEEIYYVPPQSAEALAAAIKVCAERVDETLSRVKNAQARLLAAKLTTQGRISKHVALTEELLS